MPWIFGELNHWGCGLNSGVYSVHLRGVAHYYCFIRVLPDSIRDTVHLK